MLTIEQLSVKLRKQCRPTCDPFPPQPPSSIKNQLLCSSPMHIIILSLLTANWEKVSLLFGGKWVILTLKEWELAVPSMSTNGRRMDVGRYDLLGPASLVHTCITLTGKFFHSLQSRCRNLLPAENLFHCVLFQRDKIKSQKACFVIWNEHRLTIMYRQLQNTCFTQLLADNSA